MLRHTTLRSLLKLTLPPPPLPSPSPLPSPPLPSLSVSLLDDIFCTSNSSLFVDISLMLYCVYHFSALILLLLLVLAIMHPRTLASTWHNIDSMGHQLSQTGSTTTPLMAANVQTLPFSSALAPPPPPPPTQWMDYNSFLSVAMEPAKRWS